MDKGYHQIDVDQIFQILIISVLIAGCAPARMPTAANLPAMTPTSLQESSTPSPALATSTSTPTFTFTPEATFTPTETEIPTATPAPKVPADFKPAGPLPKKHYPPAECPVIDPNYKPEFPKFIGDDLPDLKEPILVALNKGISYDALLSGLDQANIGVYKNKAPDGLPDFSFRRINLAIWNLANDGIPAIVLTEDVWLGIYTCRDGRYVLAIDIGVNPFDLDIRNRFIKDLNGDGIPEIIVHILNREVSGAEDYVYIFGWDGQEFQNQIILNDEDFRQDDYPGAYTSGGVLKFTFQDKDRNGTVDLIARWTGISLDAMVHGPWRDFIETFTWNGTGYQHIYQQLDPPSYRFQAVQDGDQAGKRGNFTQALHFYQMAINNKNLKGWSQALFMQQIDFVGIEGSGTPMPTMESVDPNEYQMLAAYSRYHIMIIHASMGQINQTRKDYESLKNDYSVDKPGYIYLKIANLFWDSFNANNDLKAACESENEYVQKNREAIFGLIDETWHGWQSPGYDYGYSGMQYLCPFE